MSEAAVLWLFGTVISVQTLVIGSVVAAIWTHQGEYREFRSTLAAAVADIRAKLDRLERDVGTHETGLRGQIHKLSSDITPFIIWAQVEQQRGTSRGAPSR